MSDGACSTCGRTGNVGKDMVNTLKEAGFFDELKQGFASAIPKIDIPTSGIDVEAVITKAIQGIKVEPKVNIVHHGLEELKNCPTCQAEYKADISRVGMNMAAKLLEGRRKAIEKDPQIDRFPRPEVFTF